MFRKRTKAFTLTELLVVVIVLGVLAAVAVPKFTRVLETRRTTEAESMLSAVRTEQEKRCSLGQNYTGDFSKIPAVAYAKSGEGRAQSANYTYALMATGASAVREGKDYVLKMPSYKSGEICCEGEGCEALNKSYPLCSEVTVEADECAATDVVAPEPEPSGPCDIDPSSCECNPNQSKCCTEQQKWDGNQCVAKTFCELNPNYCSCNPNQEICCAEDESWNSQTQQCEPNNTCQNPEYAAANPCECAADTCQCPTYAAAYPCECAANTCQCPTYAAAYPCECAPNTCECPTYAAAYPDECGTGYKWVKDKLTGTTSSTSGTECSSLVGRSCSDYGKSRECYEATDAAGKLEVFTEATTAFLCAAPEADFNCQSQEENNYRVYECSGVTFERQCTPSYCEENPSRCESTTVHWNCPSGDGVSFLDTNHSFGSYTPPDPQKLCEEKCPASAGPCNQRVYYCLKSETGQTGWNSNVVGWAAGYTVEKGYVTECIRKEPRMNVYSVVCR